MGRRPKASKGRLGSTASAAKVRASARLRTGQLQGPMSGYPLALVFKVLADNITSGDPAIQVALTPARASSLHSPGTAPSRCRSRAAAASTAILACTSR